MWCFDACAGSWFLLLVLIRWTGSSGTFPPMLCVLLLWNFQLAHNWRMSLYNGFRGCKHECCLAHIHPFTWLFSCYNAVKGNWTWLSSLQHMSKIGGFRRVSISSLLHLVPSWSEVHCWRKPISQLKPRQHILLHTLVQHSCCCSSSLSWAPPPPRHAPGDSDLPVEDFIIVTPQSSRCWAWCLLAGNDWGQTPDTKYTVYYSVSI